MRDLLQRVERLNEIGIALSAQRDTGRLLEIILDGAKELTEADGGTLYLVREDRTVEFAIMRTDSLGIALGGVDGGPVPFEPLPLEVDGRPNESAVVTSCAIHGTTISIADAYAAGGYDFSGARAFDRRTGYRTRSLLAVPMCDHEGEIIGVLQLINAIEGGEVVAFSEEAQQLAESLGSQAAVALTNRRLLDQLQVLFEALVKMIATAIDEKSPYTGAHCRRVPELTMMLADATHHTEVGPMAEFELAPDDRYALQLAAWLHDCGKIVTPEHVMDKSTKLEGVHDRIEEVAARFAACRQQIQCEHAEAIAVARARDDEARAAAAEAARDTELDALADELAFLRRVNVGSEAMTAAERERVHRLAARRWIDADGVSQPLLTDDEVANLTIPRGTLNDHERRIVEYHVVATIHMLEQLPFPRHLRNVPEYAAGHHERVDGRGYPNGLTREQMSVPARVMAIADVFEALSAADRPYKPPKPLSECLGILRKMRDDGHIDPDLFEVFVREEVYRDYAERFLDPSQIDEVDPEAILGTARA